MRSQVFAYQLVTPDHIPERIYVTETTEAIRNITRSLSADAAAAAASQPDAENECTQLIQQIIEQNNGSFILPDPAATRSGMAGAPSPAGVQLPGNLTEQQQQQLADCLRGSSNSTAVQNRLGGAVSAGLQACIDTNG